MSEKRKKEFFSNEFTIKFHENVECSFYKISILIRRYCFVLILFCTKPKWKWYCIGVCISVSNCHCIWISINLMYLCFTSTNPIEYIINHMLKGNQKIFFLLHVSAKNSCTSIAFWNINVGKENCEKKKINEMLWSMLLWKLNHKIE